MVLHILAIQGKIWNYKGQKPNVFTQLYEGHVQWKYRGLEFRTLGSWGHINDAGILSAYKGETVGSAKLRLVYRSWLRRIASGI